MSFIPPVTRLHGGAPIISRIVGHPWESKVTFNPACMLVENRNELEAIINALPFSDAIKKSLRAQPALVFLLYRAQGEQRPDYDYRRSSLGLAVLSPQLELLARHHKPVVLPDREYDNLGVEDGRLCKMGDRYFLIYTAYATGSPENQIRIALASSSDFVHWEKHGVLKGDFSNIHNKNAMLFPEKVSGSWIMLHRPMEGTDAMAIHWARGGEILGEWKTQGLLMKPIPNAAFIDTWIGGGAPPLRLSEGRYLIIYHIGNRKADGSREYDLGLALADFSKPEIIVKRVEPFLRPATAAETEGDAELGVNNVVFICGAYFYGGDLYFPYAGADSVVLGGKVSKGDLEQWLR